jgi:hypothetical protein
MSDPIFQIDDDEPEHPVARAWLARIRKGEQAKFTLWRKRDGLVFKPAKIYMTFQTPRGEERDHEDWDADLNEALVREGVRAESAANEAHRLTLMLRYWLRRPQERFDQGLFDAVLLETARDSDLADQSVLRDILDRILVAPVSGNEASYAPCKVMVEAILQQKARRSLVRDLRYTEGEATAILAAALAQYLDERFDVTERRMLGL